MSKFTVAAANALTRHGVSCTYIVKTETYNVETGAASVTSSSSTIKAYKKHIKVDQYNYPDLIGRDAAMFYILVSDVANPEVGDYITFSGNTYRIEKIQEHWAGGEKIIHRLIAAKG